MKRTLKVPYPGNKAAAILLLCGFLLPLALPYGFFQLRKTNIHQEIKERMMEGIDREELFLLKFSPETAEKQLRWENPHEFSYQGRMYDVVESEVRDGMVFYWCLMDHVETRLEKQLHNLISFALQNDAPNRDTQSHIFQFFKSFYFNETNSDDFALVFDNKWIESVLFNYSMVEFNPPSPPPELT
ncbi:MAG: hypothetical protein H6581_03980 [Bacteroidia bacterium]|nr:hypothetical protein [Bacteroidia bacterium]